jgi:multiple sugar transport system ATP-binding protein
MARVEFKNVKKSFGNTEVIHDINLKIEDHEFCVFVGPSGCGKSTLLRLIAGLEDLTDGQILIGGECVNRIQPAQRGVAMVFQSYALYPHMNVYDNIAFGIRAIKNKKIIQEKVLEAAQTLKIEGLLNRKPKQLSGGQRQRVAIGRAIVRNPKVFLFDEPLSNLDAGLRVEMRMQIARMKNRLNKTMIYVTHDQVEAMTLADKIVVLQNGYIEQVGTPLELYNSPKNIFVAGFLGSPRMNFINVSAQHKSEKQIEVILPNQKSILVNYKMAGKAMPLTLGIRPEKFQECDKEESLISGKVRIVEHLGSEIYAYITFPKGHSVMVRTAGDHPVKAGDEMHVKFPADSIHLFNKATGEALPLS